MGGLWGGCSFFEAPYQDFYGLHIFPLMDLLATGGGGGVQIEIFQASNVFFPFRTELTTGGGGVVSKFFAQKLRFFKQIYM